MKLTKAQRNCLQHVADDGGTTEWWVWARFPDGVGLSKATRSRCVQNGWLEVEVPGFPKPNKWHLTDAGRAALKDKPHD